MNILAVDTSSNICSVALLENDNLIAEKNLNNGRTHSENLMPLIEILLKENNFSLDKIDLIAVSSGPGSFTGIRIGISSIKAIAEVFDIPIAEVTSLETLAANDETNNIKIALIDARNNQVYSGIFNEKIDLIEDYIADDIHNIINKLSLYKNACIIGDGAVLYKEFLLKNANFKFIDNNSQSAKNVGKIGYKKYLENNLKNADTVMPIYLKKSQAERMKK